VVVELIDGSLEACEGRPGSDILCVNSGDAAVGVSVGVTFSDSSISCFSRSERGTVQECCIVKFSGAPGQSTALSPGSNVPSTIAGSGGMMKASCFFGGSSISR